MFANNDATQEDFEKKFPTGTNNTNAPYLQRSISAPAIAEHVSEAILPTYNYDDVDMQSSMLYQYGNNNNNPSRLNPRMANNGKKSENDGELDNYSDLLDDNNGLLSSLISDSKLRTPMDLIQADFPSTPSSVYSNRLLEQQAAASEESGENATSNATASSANSNDEHSAVDQAAKSFQNLYVTTAPQDVSPKAAPSNQTQAPLLSQYHGAQNANNSARPSNFFQNQGASQPPSNSSMLLNGGNNQSGGNSGHAQGEKNSRMFPNAHNSGFEHNSSNFNTLLGNSPTAILNNGLNPLATPVTAPMGGNGQQNLQQQGGQQTQPAYYVQQAVYLDQNGQPIYYRPGPNNGQYGQEFMYPTAGPDGNPVSMGVADQMQANYVPGYGGVAGMNQPGMPQTGYWNPSDQTQMQNGMPMYMGGQQQGMGQGGVGGLDSNRRMVYNPATGQYNSIPAQGMQGMGGNQGGRGGNQQMNSYGMMQGGQSSLGRHDQDMFHRDDDRLGGMMNRMHGGGDYGRDNFRGGDRNGGRDRDMRGGDRGGGRNNGGGSVSGSVGVNPVRDSLVEEFRATYGKSRQWGLRDLLGHVVAFCQDQHGSRFIQQRLEVCSDVDKQLIFDEIIPAAQSLMTDVFGNYVLQKLFEYGTADQCEALALLLKGQSVQLAMQMYGCRVVQKALEYVSTQRLIDLVTEFESPPLLLRCVHDSNGNHVIQKCIEIVSKVAKEASTPEMSEYLSGRIQFIIVAFQGRVKELSSHPYGCRVVQRILEHCSNSQKAVILEELRQCCTDLVQDCYGNYVIQFVMQHGWEADRAVLIREVQSNLLDFSQHKFASNVVEKCLQYANKKDRDEMIWTIINVTFDLKNPVDAKGHCVLESMVRDPYANYVVQKVIDVSDERQRAAIMRYVKENITQLRRYTYGKHIIVRLEKITNEKF